MEDERKRCAKCGKAYEKDDLVVVGDKWYCVDCVKEIARRARGVGKGGKNIGATLVVTALLSAFLGAFVAYYNYNFLQAVYKAANQGVLLSLMTYSGWVNLLLIFFFILGTYVITFGLLLMAGWVYRFGLVLNALLAFYSVMQLIDQSGVNPAGPIAIAVSALAIILALLKNKIKIIDS